jgi:hypothetical protein
MKKRFLLLAIVGFIGGCATSGKYETVLDTWIGSGEVELVKAWGPPQSVYEAGGSKFLTYSTRRNMQVPGVMPSYTTTTIGNVPHTTYNPGFPGYDLHLSCDTSFEISQGRVVNWRWQGNDCNQQ